jgi:hypothetical protein
MMARVSCRMVVLCARGARVVRVVQGNPSGHTLVCCKVKKDELGPPPQKIAREIEGYVHPFSVGADAQALASSQCVMLESKAVSDSHPVTVGVGRKRNVLDTPLPRLLREWNPCSHHFVALCVHVLDKKSCQWWRQTCNDDDGGGDSRSKNSASIIIRKHVRMMSTCTVRGIGTQT